MSPNTPERAIVVVAVIGAVVCSIVGMTFWLGVLWLLLKASGLLS